MGLISGILMGMVFGISLMAGWQYMMKYRSSKRVAKVILILYYISMIHVFFPFLLLFFFFFFFLILILFPRLLYYFYFALFSTWGIMLFGLLKFWRLWEWGINLNVRGAAEVWSLYYYWITVIILCHVLDWKMLSRCMFFSYNIKFF